jgi:hypothetical protein
MKHQLESMDTLKIKVDPTSLQIDEQSNWLGNEVDIIIKEKASTPESYKSSAAGLLSDFKDKDLMDSEKSSYAFSQFQTGRVKVN